MNLAQAFKMAFKSIWAKKTRSVLTMLGIIIGVASVVVMVSVVQAMNRQNMAYYEAIGDNKITVEAYSYTDYTGSTAQKLYDYCLSLGDLIDGITPDIQLYDQSIIQYGAKTLRTNDWDNIYDENGNVDYSKQYSIRMGSESYGICNNYTIAEGRELSYLDIEKENAVCVLGSGIKKALFDFTEAVGETINIDGQPFLVVGVYEPIGLEGWEEWDSVVVIPYTFNRSMNNNSTISSYVVKAKSAEATTEAMTKLTAFLDGMFPMNADGYRDSGSFYVQSNNNWSEQMEAQGLMQSLVLGAIAGISLLVGGIGIMNIMLVTVTERTREIGIRKAIGAERKSIVAQFLIEAAVICGIGGLIGIAFGVMGTMIAGKMLITGMKEVLYPDFSIALGAFAFSVVLGVIFGMYPAVKASGLQPVEALRAD